MRRLVLVTAAVGAALALAMPVVDAEAASTGAQIIAASGSFAESLVPTNVRTVDGVTFFDASAIENLTGTLSGVATVTGSCIVPPDGHATCSGRETLTGTVAGRPGTVVWFVVAQIDFVSGAISGSFAIITGSGGLAGLHGAGTFTGTNGTGTYSGHLVFAP